MVICNLTTQQMKVLPPSNFEPPPHVGKLRASCLGYDATSKDYKSYLAPTTGKCALVSWRPDGYRSSSPLFIKLFVRKAMSWNMLYVVSLAHVKDIAGLVDNNLLILEVKHSSRSGQLMVYDLQTGNSKKLSIYDYPRHMSFHSYVESKDLLPDSKPITMIPYVESTDPLPITSESEEEMVTWKMMLKNPPIRRRGSKMKRKRTRKVSKNNPKSRKSHRLTSNSDSSQRHFKKLTSCHPKTNPCCDKGFG
ncbi:hypothetical protein OROGR_007503 [Orobanche gracilis]